MKKFTKKLAFVAISCIIAILLTGCIVGLGTKSSTNDTNTTNTNTNTTDMQPNRTAIIQTSMGIMELELFEKRAPITTKNFIDLAEKGYYDGLTFHRIMDDFMIQGGDPSGDGSGGPGYSIPDEFHLELKHTKAGILSMANSGPDSGGSQFFVTLAPTDWLDGKHAVFGQIVNGMDVLERIGAVDTDMGAKPLEPVIMEKVLIKLP